MTVFREPMADTPLLIEAKHRLFTGVPFTVYAVCNRFTEKMYALDRVLGEYRCQSEEEDPITARGFLFVPGPIGIYFPNGMGGELCVENLIEAMLLSRGKSLFCGPDVSEMRQDFCTLNGSLSGTLRAGVDYQGGGYCLEARAELRPPFTPNTVMYRNLQRALSIFPPKEQSVAQALALHS